MKYGLLINSLGDYACIEYSSVDIFICFYFFNLMSVTIKLHLLNIKHFDKNQYIKSMSLPFLIIISANRVFKIDYMDGDLYKLP